jgi:hypothetical protein
VSGTARDHKPCCSASARVRTIATCRIRLSGGGYRRLYVSTFNLNLLLVLLVLLVPLVVVVLLLLLEIPTVYPR